MSVPAVFPSPDGGREGGTDGELLGAPARLEALRKTGLLASDPDERFDRLTRLTAHALQSPVSLVCLVTEEQQIFKSCFGLSGPIAACRRTPLNYSFCKHTVITGRPLIIPDTRVNPLSRNNPSVPEFGAIAYAGMPLVVESGQVIGALCVIDNKPRDWTELEISILRDLAASVMTEINLQAAKEKAEAANSAKDRFLAILSHELRTPLSPSLMVVASIAGDPTLPDHVREDAAMAQRNIEQQTHLIDDLLDITRIENGKLAMRREAIDVHEVLKQTHDACRAEIESRGVRVCLALQSACPTISGDINRMQQVFHNLLRNALKFTPAGGEVTIETEDTDDGVLRIMVRDTGIGISPEVLPTLFEPFAQGLRPRTDNHGGLGLGLAISRGIVEAHGGTIRAQSEGENLGTRLTVDLPPADPVGAPPPKPHLTETLSAASSSESGKPVSILLVDDHQDTLRAMSRLLRQLEHRVVTATCVQGALRAADKENFDLLISDLGLPDGTGLDLMRQLLGRQPIRGIALTGYGSDSDLRKTREAGFSAHLTKPIDFRALESAIRSVAVGGERIG
jgi:signal transduction histidine kinase/ActR/RegA family two-component response regulator